jgi:hypothetical protein
VRAGLGRGAATLFLRRYADAPKKAGGSGPAKKNCKGGKGKNEKKEKWPPATCRLFQTCGCIVCCLVIGFNASKIVGNLKHHFHISLQFNFFILVNMLIYYFILLSL